MNKTTESVPAGDSNDFSIWRRITRPVRVSLDAARFLLRGVMQVARTSPMTGTAILLVAGAVSFLARSYHVGTLFISAVGVLWMWQDMLNEDARPVAEATLPVAVA